VVSLLELEQQVLQQALEQQVLQQALEQAVRPVRVQLLVQVLVQGLRALVLRVQLPQVWELRLLGRRQGWRLGRRRHHRYEQGPRLLRQSHPRRQESPE
jgi:hypothetical protein